MSIANNNNTDPEGLNRVGRTAATIVSVEEFFHDKRNTPWRPLSEHSLKKSLLSNNWHKELSQL
jgi:hypothetical protein